jgi:hypothetical protein
MTIAEKRGAVRQHLEAALRLQRESWDEVDMYALVAELAGGLKDDETIPKTLSTA